MLINKNKSEKNLNQFQYSITKVINLFISISLGFFVAFYLGILFFNNKKDATLYKELLSNTNKLLQANISAQIATIANSTDFIRYIQSGEVTRNKYAISIKWLFANLDYKLIKGVTITDKSNHLLLQYGGKTPLFTNLNICYLENRVNASMGDCKCSLLIYFDKDEYLTQLHKLNNRILLNQKDKNGLLLNPFDTSFGVFHSPSHSSIELEFNRKIIFNPVILVVIIVSLFGMVIALILSHKYLNRKIKNDLILPIHNLINMLHGSDLPQKQPNIISEFNELIDVVNQYNNQQLNQRFNKIVARVVHDIKSPLAVIELSSADLMGNNNPKRLTIKNAIRSVRAIVSNMLLTYAGKLNVYSEFDTLKSYILVHECIEEIIEQKHVEWSLDAEKFIIDYNNIDLYNDWVFLSAIEFKRHISNLLNNSFEAINGEKIHIKIDISTINDFIYLTIVDNGIGIKESLVANLQTIQSSKETGSGIGLTSAIDYFTTEGGMFEINPLKSGGTNVEIYLKQQQTPIWFTNVIEVKQNLVIVDDNVSMLEYWENKLCSMNINLITFTSPYKFQEWYKEIQKDFKFTFLLDYDYNERINGIDLVRLIIDCKKDCYLITSSYSDFKLQEFVQTMQIKMIPKCMLGTITLNFKSNYNIIN